MAYGATTGLRRIDPVLRWNAPYGGSVTFGGTLQKLATGGNGVVATIYQTSDNGQGTIQLWQRTFAPCDVSPCIPSGTGDCGGTGLSISVSGGDRLYTTLNPFDNGGVAQVTLEGAGNDMAWDPTITYTTASDSQGNSISVGPTQLTQREPYGSKIFQFEQKVDHRIFGAPGTVQWTAISKGTVQVQGDIQMASASDAVTFQVVLTTASNQAQTTLLQQQLGASGGTVSLSGVALQNVNPGDRILFEMSSNTPIDPLQVTWAPSVTYQSYCAADPNSGQDVCGAVTCSSNTTCAIAGLSDVTVPKCS